MKSKIACCECGRVQVVTHHETQEPLEVLGWEGEWGVFRSIDTDKPLMAICPDCLEECGLR